MFDRHHDSLDPYCTTEISSALNRGVTFESIVALCKDALSKNDNDWLVAGMQLGLLADALILGAEGDNIEFPKIVRGANGTDRRIDVIPLPRAALGYQGALTDVIRHYQYKAIWDTLAWHPQESGGYWFDCCAPRVLLDIDLDCFVCTCQGVTFPWPDEVFEREFISDNSYGVAGGTPGVKFVGGLLQRAGAVTIAMEPDYCGGETKAKILLEKVSTFMFGGGLRL